MLIFIGVLLVTVRSSSGGGVGSSSSNDGSGGSTSSGTVACVKCAAGAENLSNGCTSTGAAATAATGNAPVQHSAVDGTSHAAALASSVSAAGRQQQQQPRQWQPAWLQRLLGRGSSSNAAAGSHSYSSIPQREPGCAGGPVLGQQPHTEDGPASAAADTNQDNDAGPFSIAVVGDVQAFDAHVGGEQRAAQFEFF